MENEHDEARCCLTPIIRNCHYAQHQEQEECWTPIWDDNDVEEECWTPLWEDSEGDVDDEDILFRTPLWKDDYDEDFYSNGCSPGRGEGEQEETENRYTSFITLKPRNTNSGSSISLLTAASFLEAEVMVASTTETPTQRDASAVAVVSDDSNNDDSSYEEEDNHENILARLRDNPPEKENALPAVRYECKLTKHPKGFNVPLVRFIVLVSLVFIAGIGTHAGGGTSERASTCSTGSFYGNNRSNHYRQRGDSIAFQAIAEKSNPKVQFFPEMVELNNRVQSYLVQADGNLKQMGETLQKRRKERRSRRLHYRSSKSHASYTYY
mmetsp:Transcript_27407/g.51433  ORF Transcript_27407/g.51433 Transcript_27407/m.51433 type:complete len:324 (-) Transcript_27407:393-1364(-)